IEPAAAGKCDGKLREGCAAPSGEDRLRTWPNQRPLSPARHVGHSKCQSADRARDSIPAQTAWRPPVNPWIIAVTVTLATFMEVLDTSVANVALPHIAGSLSAGQDESTWV